MKFNVELIKNIDNSYPIIIEKNILHFAQKYIGEATNAKKILIVTNKTVAPLYLQKLRDGLSGYILEVVFLDDGEEFKNNGSLQKIWDKAVEIKLERSDAILALGGGVVGDIAGFAAASYLRGVDFIQVPTTLLAQVDSSVGGKVAINHSAGKNLLGAFYQPKLVLIDIDTLKTLPARELKTGLAEVLKYSFIEQTCGCGENFGLMKFLDENKDAIFNLDDEILKKLIFYCCKLKASVVSQDEKERGLRAILNLGHTIGHAIEKVTEYKVFTHGEAVAMGIVGAFKLSLSKRLIDEKYFDNALDLIKKYELLYEIPETITSEKIVEAVNYDKKIQAGKIRFVLPTDIEQVKIYSDVSFEQMKEAVNFIRNM